MSAANTAESADFRGPLDITRAATMVLDAESTVIGWSPAAAELLGYEPSEVLGRPLSTFLSAHPVTVGGASSDGPPGPSPPPEPLDPSGPAEPLDPSGPSDPSDPSDVAGTAAPGLGPSSLVGNEIHVARTRDGRELLVATATCPLPGGAAGSGTPGAPDRIVVAAEVGELRHWESRIALLQGLATQSPVGLAIYDTDLRLTWCNTAYEREIGQPLAAFRGMRADELYSGGSFVSPGYPRTLDGVMHQVIDTGEPILDLNFRGQPPSDPGRDHLWSCAYYRLEDAHGHVFGVCEDAFDITDRYRVQERLALLVEAGRRIGTVLDVATTAEEIAEVAVPDFAAAVRVDVTRAAVTGETAAVGSTADMSLLRVAERSEPGAGAPDLALPETGPPEAAQAPDASDGAPAASGEAPAPYPPVGYPPGSPQHRSLSSGGLVLDEGTLVVPLRAGGGILGLVTFERGVGPDASGRALAPDRATTFDNGEVALADELTARTAVCIDNARRYTRERTASLALQRQLLPHHLPPQSAVETAYRYLLARRCDRRRRGLVRRDPAVRHPGRSGGGGRGRARAPGGRHHGLTRTSVRAFAQLDMAPDELLTRLDDLVGQPAEDRSDAYGGAVETYDVTTGATCLYAVYDPVSRRCVMARAGHLPPAIVEPGGRVSFPDLPAGPPLGLGGLPFESMEIDLPVGSLLALFTDGLVEARDHDIGQGLDALGGVLGGGCASLEELCDRAVSELVPGGTSADDTALLLVRTRELDAEQVADWELTAEPVSVGRARELATGQLAAWGLEELSFATELVVSELVTNAVRYGGGPLGLRLIRDRTLVCEVSDTGHTSPHLRHSAEDDEGGRGLFIVAQLVQRWGTRYTPTGKTIWTEQTLPSAG